VVLSTHLTIAYSCRFNGTSNFTRNSVQSGDGGAIYTTTNTLLHFSGISHFSDNFAQISGGAIYTLSNTTLSFTGTSNFDSNFAMQGGAIFAKSNNTLTFDGSISFTNNGYDAGKLNTNTLGGGMYLDMNSTFSIVPNTTIHWENNHARLGGAIYADDNHNPFIYCNIIDAYKEKTNCFFQLPGWNLSNTIDVHLVFKNNFADVAGSVLYGGAVDHCKLTGLESHNSGEIFNKIVHIDDENTTSSISSLPFHICPCDEHHSDCSTSHNRFSVYPGEMFHVSVVACGQRDGTIPAAVISHTDHGNLLGFQYIQQANNYCTKLNYSLFSTSYKETLVLYADGLCSTFGKKLVLDLIVNHTCPPGFELSQSARSCVCEQRLKYYTNQCNIKN